MERRNGRQFEYEGYVKFNPDTIETFGKPIRVEDASREIGRPNPLQPKPLQSHFKQKLNLDEYQKLLNFRDLDIELSVVQYNL